MTGACGHDAEFVRFRPNGVKECVACRRARNRRHKQARKETRTPIVFANRKAVEEWHRLGRPRALENVILDLLRSRGLRDAGEGRAWLQLDDVTVAELTRTRSISGRKAWLAVGVRSVR